MSNRNRAGRVQAPAPVSQAPEATEAQAPEAQAPEATEAQAPEATEAQAPEATEAQAPQADAPQADAPQADAPQDDAPQADAPQADALAVKPVAVWVDATGQALAHTPSNTRLLSAKGAGTVPAPLQGVRFVLTIKGRAYTTKAPHNAAMWQVCRDVAAQHGGYLTAEACLQAAPADLAHLMPAFVRYMADKVGTLAPVKG